MPTWLRYSLALVLAVLIGTISAIPDFTLPSPQDSGWSPLIALVHAVVVGAAFSLVFFGVTILFGRPQGDVPQNKLRRGVFVFLLFAGGDLGVELLARPLFSRLSSHAALQDAVLRVVQAGNGWFLPLIMLIVFVAFILLRFRRA
jgi:hypothetical protein